MDICKSLNLLSNKLFKTSIVPCKITPAHFSYSFRYIAVQFLSGKMQTQRFLRRLLVETIGTHTEKGGKGFPINIHRGTLGNAVERSLVVSRGKSNRSRRLQTRAAQLQACMPGCIRVGVTEAVPKSRLRQCMR